MPPFAPSRRRLLTAASASLAALGLRAAPPMSAGPAPAARDLDAAAISASDYCPDSPETTDLDAYVRSEYGV